MQNQVEYARIRRTKSDPPVERITEIKLFQSALDPNEIARFKDGPRKLRQVIDERPDFDPLKQKLGDETEMVIETDRVLRRWPIEALSYDEQVVAVRAARKLRYEAELGEQAGFEQTVGDSIDALIKAAYGDRAALDAMAAQILVIKADIPKPAEPVEEGNGE